MLSMMAMAVFTKIRTITPITLIYIMAFMYSK